MLATYRVYCVGSTGKIIAGQWVEASDDSDACSRAQDVCNALASKVEVWEGGRFVATLECAAAGSGMPPTPRFLAEVLRQKQQ